jgi:hypothetical protein
MPELFLELSLFPVHPANMVTGERKRAINITVFLVNKLILFLSLISAG